MERIRTKTDLLGDLYEVFAAYYNVNSYGHWENGNYVLIRDHSDRTHRRKVLSFGELESQIQAALKRLKQARDLRPNRPRLDDKILTSWNALYLQGLVDASRYLQNDEYLKKALALGRFVQKNLKQEEGGLYRNYKENQASIPAFLDDYAALIEAYISLYEMSGETEWLEESEQLLPIAIHTSVPEKTTCTSTLTSNQPRSSGALLKYPTT